MATNFLTKIFGSRNDRLLKQYRSTVVRINAMEPELERLTDEALRAKTQEFKIGSPVESRLTTCSPRYSLSCAKAPSAS
jgi:preprotein translocase subunit SecA